MVDDLAELDPDVAHLIACGSVGSRASLSEALLARCEPRDGYGCRFASLVPRWLVAVVLPDGEPELAVVLTGYELGVVAVDKFAALVARKVAAYRQGGDGLAAG